MSSKELNTLSNGCNDMRPGTLEFLQRPQTVCSEHCPFTLKGHFRCLLVLESPHFGLIYDFSDLSPLFYNDICFFHTF